jgi:hypothetical protein
MQHTISWPFSFGLISNGNSFSETVEPKSTLQSNPFCIESKIIPKLDANCNLQLYFLFLSIVLQQCEHKIMSWIKQLCYINRYEHQSSELTSGTTELVQYFRL